MPIRTEANTSDRGAGLVLGIDPGLQRTGYALLSPHGRDGRLVEAGVIRLNTRLRLEQRLLQLEQHLDELLEQTRPAALACEELYAHYKHPRTAILMGHARGVILALAARRGLRVTHVAATHVKKLLTGNGHAGKAQVQRAIAATLGLASLPEPHDVADAMAIALCGLRMGDAAQRATAAAQAEPQAHAPGSDQTGPRARARKSICPQPAPPARAHESIPPDPRPSVVRGGPPARPQAFALGAAMSPEAPR